MEKTIDDEIRIADASFPKPFVNGLEFNAPVHGTWNIVHIGLAMPEAIQIYVCAKNCMRGVVLTAAEMNRPECFSYVILNEEDMIRENIDDVTIEGVKDVLTKRIKAGQKPRAVQLFTVCVHHFLGSNYEYIYRTLEEEFPDIDFYRCYMDPVMQKKGLTPDQKLRRAMFSKLPECDTKGNVVAILGGDFCFDRGSDLVRFLEWSGCDLRQVQSAKTYDEYLKLSEACLFIDVHPAGETGVSNSAKRLGRNYLYLPATFDYDEIDAELKKLADALDIDASDFLRDNGKYKSLIEDKLLTLKNKLSDTEIAIDATAHPRPLGLAKFLIEHGFTVKKVYLDVINPEEKEAFDKLKTIAPDLVLSATVHVKKRHLLEPEKNVLAIGQKAAYFEQTGHFVNLVNGGNLWGYSGIKTMLDIMDDAYENEKDTRDIVPRKGFGCVSCVEKYI